MIHLKRIGTKDYQALEREIIVKIRRAIPKGDLAFTNATLITMKGKEVISNGTILIKR